MKKNIDIIKISTCIILISILFPLIYFISNILPHKIDINKINFNDNSNIIYNIDKFEEGTLENILISGWIINKNEDNSVVNIKVLCKNIDTGNIYEIKTFYDKRNDVTKAIDDNYNYDFSGFNSKIIRIMLPEKGKYKIMILFKQSDKYQLNNKNFIIETPYDFYKN